MAHRAVLHVMSGKLASGKTTFAERLAETLEAVFISEDVWLSVLFPGQIGSFQDYLVLSGRFRRTIEIHIRSLLRKGLSVVFDFGGNAPKERAWVKAIARAEKAGFMVHYLRASNETCKSRLRRRNRKKPMGSKPTTMKEFDSITRFFVPPSRSEGFDMREYAAGKLILGTSPGAMVRRPRRSPRNSVS
ncbi:ATP-binding protein [Nitrospira sp. KM1]|uniref:AAA family ATPase n=1 Tax=Nitrospira sp. KM1 TaxID=1936990 RepID=UPI001565041C|nr:ATP-binding protein [Nitrospira sp. KM1]